MYNGATEDTPDKAQQGLLTERGMPPCILLIASRPALRERDIGTASMREAVKIEPVLEARKLDRTVCLRAFSILSPEMYPKACSRQNEKIKLHRPSLFSLRSGSAKEAENADGMTSENASHKNSGAPESLSLFLLPPYHSSGAFGTMKPPHTVPLYQTHRMLLQLADQLSVSAVARGAERPGVRGSYYEQKAGARDYIAAAACALVTASYLVLERSMA